VEAVFADPGDLLWKRAVSEIRDRGTKGRPDEGIGPYEDGGRAASRGGAEAAPYGDGGLGKAGRLCWGEEEQRNE
jgi:hypothetical protein